MKALQKLAGQTAIYGLPSIIGRLLNYLLVPLHTGKFMISEYGEIVGMYAYVSFLVVLLTYGMEIAYFRFQSKNGNHHNTIFSTVLLSLFSTTILFIFLATFFSQSIAEFLNYPNNSEYVVWFAFIVGLDAISSIPLARLRIENKAIKFASVNMINIFVNIALNLFWIGYCIPEHQAGNSNFFIENFYTPSIGIGYVFIANLFASIIKFLLLTPSMFSIRFKFDLSLFKQMLLYGSPILISGMAVIVNENADKILIQRILEEKIGLYLATAQVGIYGGVYKLSIIISLFIQAFRYAAEPFFFSQEKEKDSKETYATIMKYFVIVCAFIFLAVMLYLDQLKHFVNNEEYWVGLSIVPILLFANIFLGIFYNLSVWYKLSGKTKYGAYIALFGATITIVLNLILIPRIGYLGSAWATLICYFSMATISYFYGQKHFKIDYSIKSIFFY
ncbi:MAG: polysaccharide biosynthesis C-terminal domain-containing protein [Flavobacteriales bacterium]|nr:polysaccharide biosynthesis C-terminal domain-containing protein [Flavobacteriales bacterium]